MNSSRPLVIFIIVLVILAAGFFGALEWGSRYDQRLETSQTAATDQQNQQPAQEPGNAPSQQEESKKEETPQSQQPAQENKSQNQPSTPVPPVQTPAPQSQQNTPAPSTPAPQATTTPTTGAVAATHVPATGPAELNLLLSSIFIAATIFLVIQLRRQNMRLHFRQ